MRRARAALLPALVFWLAACSGPEPRGIAGDDGAPLVPIAAADVADAVPRPDPLLPAGNTSPYVIEGREYRVLASATGYEETGVASWYGTKFHGQRTANGEIYDLYLATAAHRSLPLPSYVRVTNLRNDRQIVVRVNDRGPFHSERLIDLSYAAAVRLGFAEQGTTEVRVETIELAGVDDRRGQPGGEYRYLQLGAFSSLRSARELRDSVSAMVEVPVRVSPVDVGGQRLNRVRLGPVDDGRELQRLRDLLLARGYAAGLALP